jgi:hypothetical protein
MNSCLSRGVARGSGKSVKKGPNQGKPAPMTAVSAEINNQPAFAWGKRAR